MSKQIEEQRLTCSTETNRIIFIMMGVGLLTCVLGLFTNAPRTWYAFLVSDLLFLGLPIGAMAFLAMHFLASSGWLVLVRRIPEALISYLKFGVPLTLLLLFGLGQIYPWTDHELMHNDHMLHHKATYFSFPFFMFRMLLFFGVVLYFAKKMLGNSLQQDKEGGTELSNKQRPLSALYLVLFAPLFTIFSMDLIMSLEPKWFSTIFGVYVFTGYIQTSIAACIVVIYCLKKSGYLKEVTIEHVHDLTKYLFGWSIFWAYIAVSQYLLIWYANLPEETFYFIAREKGSWTCVSLLMPFLKFVVPFAGLMAWKCKRNLTYVTIISLVVIFSEWLDLTWMIMPVLDPEGFTLAWQDIGMLIGFTGVFSFALRKFFMANPMVPLKDPFAHESLKHHVV